MKKTFIYGAGGIALELYELLNHTQKPTEGLIVDDVYYEECKQRIDKYKIPLFKFNDVDMSSEKLNVIVSFGEPINRERAHQLLLEKGCEELNVDLSSYHSSIETHTDKGCIFHIGSMISANVKIGISCLVNKSAIVGHDSIIDDFCVISPHVSIGGGVHIGRKCFIGLGACIRDRITIGENTIIGMGSVVTHNIPDNSVVVGNPGKVIRHNDSKKVFK